MVEAAGVERSSGGDDTRALTDTPTTIGRPESGDPRVPTITRNTCHTAPSHADVTRAILDGDLDLARRLADELRALESGAPTLRSVK